MLKKASSGQASGAGSPEVAVVPMTYILSVHKVVARIHQHKTVSLDHCISDN